MNSKQLLELALSQVKAQSLTTWKGKKVVLLWDGKTEYTSVPEEHLSKVLEVEPNLITVCTLLDGERL